MESIKKVPGFRSGTWWKSVIAVMVYVGVIGIAIDPFVAEPPTKANNQQQAVNQESQSQSEEKSTMSSSPDIVAVESLDVSRSDIQVWLHSEGFTFRKRAEISGQLHMQGTSKSGASISLIGPTDTLTQIEFTFEVVKDPEINNVNIAYLASVLKVVLDNSTGDAMTWIGGVVEDVGTKNKSIRKATTYNNIKLIVGADPDGYVSIKIKPAR